MHSFFLHLITFTKCSNIEHTKNLIIIIIIIIISIIIISIIIIINLMIILGAHFLLALTHS